MKNNIVINLEDIIPADYFLVGGKAFNSMKSIFQNVMP